MVDGEAGHLGQAAGHQQAPRVLAQAEAGDDAGRDGDDVLERPAKLNADHVVVGVHATPWAGERPLRDLDHLRIVARHHGGGGQPRENLGRDVGTTANSRNLLSDEGLVHVDYCPIPSADWASGSSQA